MGTLKDLQLRVQSLEGELKTQSQFHTEELARLNALHDQRVDGLLASLEELQEQVNDLRSATTSQTTSVSLDATQHLLVAEDRLDEDAVASPANDQPTQSAGQSLHVSGDPAVADEPVIVSASSSAAATADSKSVNVVLAPPVAAITTARNERKFPSTGVKTTSPETTSPLQRDENAPPESPRRQQDDTGDVSKANLTTTSSYSDAAARPAANSAANNTRQESARSGVVTGPKHQAGVWEHVSSRRSRQRKPGNLLGAKCVKRTPCHLRGVSLESTAEQIVAYCRERKVLVTGCHFIRTRVWGTQSAKIFVGSDCLESVTASSFWPEFIKCRKWESVAPPGPSSFNW